MRKSGIAAFLLIAAICLTACKAGGTAPEAPEQTGTAAESVSDLSRIADSVRGYYGDGLRLVFKEDEYSDEVLMFTYGLMDDRYTDAVEDFVLSECDGMSADTFALIVFKDGTEKALIEDAAEVMKREYVTALQKKLSAYNPEEFAASDGYRVEIHENAVLMVISSENTQEIIDAVGLK